MAIHHQLPIYKQGYDLLSLAADVQQNMPRAFKASLGAKIHNECVEILVLIGRATARKRLATLPAANIFEAGNSYLGLLRQASHSHHDRTTLGNVLRKRGHRIKRDMTKIFRRPT